MSKTIDTQKFCKMPQIDINNIYLGPSQILQHCSCPSPPLYLETEPIDEGYINDSRYISEKDRELYEKEFYDMIKVHKERQMYLYNYQPIIVINNTFSEEENYDDDNLTENSDEEDDDYIDDGDFEIVGKK